MEARQAREGGQSGQDKSDDIDKDTLVDPIPTHAEALGAVKDKNNPFFQQLDSTLGTFGRQTHTLDMNSILFYSVNTILHSE
jgi:hypothetical protein